MINFRHSNQTYAATKQMYKASYLLATLSMAYQYTKNFLYNTLFLPVFSLAAILSPTWTVKHFPGSIVAIAAMTEGVNTYKRNLVKSNGELGPLGNSAISRLSGLTNKLLYTAIFLLFPLVALGLTLYNTGNLFRSATVSWNNAITKCCCREIEDLEIENEDYDPEVTQAMIINLKADASREANQIQFTVLNHITQRSHNEIWNSATKTWQIVNRTDAGAASNSYSFANNMSPKSAAAGASSTATHTPTGLIK